MMGIASEIREAIVKRGGTPPSNGGIAASLDVLNKLNSGGGSSGGGGSVINIVEIDYENMTATLDKTYEEIVAMVQSDPHTVIVQKQGENIMAYRLSMAMPDLGYIEFNVLGLGDNGFMAQVITVRNLRATLSMYTLATT